ncbi:MAG: transglutaminase-like domain-containing protein [Bacteroidales bacterium]
MIETQNISLPIPTIVITTDVFSVTTVAQIRNIYLRSDPRRQQITQFFSLLEMEDGSLQLASLDEVIIKEGNIKEEGPRSDPPNRQSVFQKTLKCADALKNRIEQALYDIRNHELLIQAGWVEEYDVPVNIYLLADVKDPFAAGAFLPISCLLQDIAENSNLCNVYALINTAVFPRIVENSKDNLDMEVYTFLLELDDLLQGQSKNRENLCKALSCEYSRPLSMTVYLFDCHKEGSYVVKNNEHMQIMVGNALLALMEKDMARRVDAMHDPFEVAEQQSYYNSIGCVAFVYDPETLQSACAKKVAYEFLKTVILTGDIDVQVAAHEAVKIEKKLGDLRAWLERGVSQMPPVIGQVRIDSTTHELSVLLSDLRLSEIDYEHFCEIPWVQQIKDYAAHSELEIRQQTFTTISNNIKQIETDLSGEINVTIDSLPINPDLYPGGIQNALQTLTFLSEYLLKESRQIGELQKNLQQKQAPLSQRIEQNLERIQTILSHAPKLPWAIRVLPKFLRVWAAPIFYAHQYGKQILLFRTLKDECLKLLQTQSSIQIQNEILDLVVGVLPRLIQLIENGKSEYQVLKEKADTAAQQIPSDWLTFPLDQVKNGWNEVFRVSVVEKCLADWCFVKWHPSYEKWIYEFLTDKSPFMDWRNISTEVIVAWLTSLGTRGYAPLWRMSIDDVFGLWEDNTPGFISAEPISLKSILKGIKSAFPLLKPDFDAVGGSRLSMISTHGLLGSPEWRQLKDSSLSPQFAKMDLIYTGDPFTELFLQIRHSISLQSLSDMIRSGKHRFSALSEEKKGKYYIIPIRGDVIRPISTDEKDSPDPDIVHKIFQWKFRPKGSGVEIEQSISLDISRSRFEYYRRMSRFNGGWNRYAEEEMPEIRLLALEFQRLHSNQKWSTYNQAFNVLKFVQSCIPYTDDRDTTGYEDWARYPIETLMEATGDCEDVAILCAAVIARLGFQVVLLVYPSHLAFGVAGADQLKGDYVVEPKTNRRYFYGEATSNGWHLGQIPKSFVSMLPQEVMPVTILIGEE